MDSTSGKELADTVSAVYRHTSTEKISAEIKNSDVPKNNVTHVVFALGSSYIIFQKVELKREVPS